MRLKCNSHRKGRSLKYSLAARFSQPLRERARCLSKSEPRQVQNNNYFRTGAGVRVLRTDGRTVDSEVTLNFRMKEKKNPLKHERDIDSEGLLDISISISISIKSYLPKIARQFNLYRSLMFVQFINRIKLPIPRSCRGYFLAATPYLTRESKNEVGSSAVWYVSVFIPPRRLFPIPTRFSPFISSFLHPPPHADLESSPCCVQFLCPFPRTPNTYSAILWQMRVPWELC